MKIERENRAERNIQQFADEHQLTMRVTEYASPPRTWRFAASFKGVEVMEPCVLVGVYGDGNTENEAIADYAKRISGKRLAENAMSPERREFYAPQFLPYDPGAV